MIKISDRELRKGSSFLKKDFNGGRCQGRIDILEEWHEKEGCINACNCNQKTGDNPECWFNKRITELKRNKFDEPKEDKS